MDEAFYLSAYRDMVGDASPDAHYRGAGWAAGLMPDADFDPLVARLAFPELGPETAEAALREEGLATRLDAMAADVLERVESADAFFWRFSDTQVHKDPARRTAEHRTGRAALDQPGEIPFGAEGRRYAIRRSGPEEMRDLIASGAPFIRPRLPHGFWDMMGRLAEITPIVSALWGPLDETALRRLGLRILRRIFPANPLLAENFVEELLGVIADAGDASPVCIALKAHPETPDLPFGTADPSPRRAAAAMAAVETAFPVPRVFEDGIAWKRFVAAGSLGEILPAIRARRVVLIANAGFADLGARWRLPDFHHLEIPPRDSHLDRYAIFERLAASLEALLPSDPSAPGPLVLTQAGGSFSFWLMHRLRRRAPNAGYLDVGQALNPWFLDDPATGKPEMLWLQDYWEDIFEANDLDAFYRDILQVDDVRAWFGSRYFDGSHYGRLPDFGGDGDFAALLVKFGRPERATVFAERALAAAPHSAMCHFRLAQLRRDAGRAEEALSLAERAIELNGGLQMARLLRGALLFERGDYRAFLDAMDAAEIDEDRKPVRMIAAARAKLG